MSVDRSSSAPADWELPPGVSRGLWEYAHSSDIARLYDDRLADTDLLRFDVDFVREHLPKPCRVIDLGCGTGRMSIALAAAGFHVAAVDLSEEMLRVVGEKAAGAGVRVDRAKANLVDLGSFSDRSFDAALCMFQTLGMIAGHDQRRRAIEHVHRILRPGGAFLLHVHNRWYNARTPHGRRLLAGDLISSLAGRRAPGDYLMPPHDGLGPMPMHLFTRREIEQSLDSAGFRIVETRPISTTGPLRHPWLLGQLRAYGYLIAARSSLVE